MKIDCLINGQIKLVIQLTEMYDTMDAMNNLLFKIQTNE